MRWVIAIAVIGCSPVSTPVKRPVPRVEVLQLPRAYTFTPADPPEVRYAEAVVAPASMTGLEAQVLADTQARADARMFRACRELQTIAVAGQPLPQAAIDLAWSHNGLVEPASIIAMRTDDAHAVARALGQVPPGARVGVASGSTVVAAIVRPKVSFEPFPRKLDVDAAFAIVASVDSSVTSVEAEIAWDDHVTQRLSPSLTNGSFRLDIPCDLHPGRARVSLDGDGSAGIIDLARFSIACGHELAREIVIDPLADDRSDDRDPDKAARHLFEMIQRDRLDVGLEPLDWDANVARTARVHAQDLLRARAAAKAPAFHQTPLASSMILESLVQATSVAEAHARLVEDPRRVARSHAPSLNSGAVGVAIGDDGKLYISQISVHTSAVVDPIKTASEVANSILRSNRHLELDPDLMRIAQILAQLAAAGASHEELYYAAKHHSNMLSYSAYFLSITTTIDITQLDPHALVNVPDIDRFGVGLVQAPNVDLGPNTLWISTLMAKLDGNYQGWLDP